MVYESIRIHAIEEVATGYDETMGATLLQARLTAGLSVRQMTQATGLRAGEVQALEQGRIDAFAGPAALRVALLTYCEQLRLDPGPFMARLEPYERRQLLLSADHAIPSLLASRQRWSWTPVVRLAAVAVLTGLFVVISGLIGPPGSEQRLAGELGEERTTGSLPR